MKDPFYPPMCSRFVGSGINLNPTRAAEVVWMGTRADRSLRRLLIREPNPSPGRLLRKLEGHSRGSQVCKDIAVGSASPHRGFDSLILATPVAYGAGSPRIVCLVVRGNRLMSGSSNGRKLMIDGWGRTPKLVPHLITEENQRMLVRIQPLTPIDS